jgi:hypothetical protein
VVPGQTGWGGGMVNASFGTSMMLSQTRIYASERSVFAINNGLSSGLASAMR